MVWGGGHQEGLVILGPPLGPRLDTNHSQSIGTRNQQVPKWFGDANRKHNVWFSELPCGLHHEAILQPTTTRLLQILQKQKDSEARSEVTKQLLSLWLSLFLCSDLIELQPRNKKCKFDQVCQMANNSYWIQDNVHVCGLSVRPVYDGNKAGFLQLPF